VTIEPCRRRAILASRAVDAPRETISQSPTPVAPAQEASMAKQPPTKKLGSSKRTKPVSPKTVKKSVAKSKC
jgi:hypothetical protein